MVPKHKALKNTNKFKKVIRGNMAAYNRLKLRMIPMIAIVVLYINNTSGTLASEVKQSDKDMLNENRELDRFTARYIANGTFHTGHQLWDNILNKCTVDPSVSCLQSNVYGYLEESVGVTGDVNVTDYVCFRKNNFVPNKYSKEFNVLTNELDDDFRGRAEDESSKIEDEYESESPLEEVTDALYGRSVNFLMTHDLSVTLPDTFFHGARLTVSPRALTKTGALVHLELEPKTDVEEGRIFFKKIKQYFKKKLIMAALAIILVVKLIKLKLLFFLPVLVGLTTAKKMVLKILLFFFPALSHIFKLCHWYHNNYHTTKFHHHHHHVSHHHHKGAHAPVHHPYGPNAHVVTHHQPNAPNFEHYNQDWELSGPGLGSEYIGSGGIHRNSNFKPNVNDVNDINAWGLGFPPGLVRPGMMMMMFAGQAAINAGEYPGGAQLIPNVSPTVAANFKIPPMTGRPVGPPSQMSRPKWQQPKDKHDAEKEALIRAAALAARAPPSPVRDELLRVSAVQLAEANRVSAESKLVKQQQKILAATDPDLVASDKFYGKLVEKVETILSPLGAKDPGCRERAVCSLYRDPIQHTPYSNLVSNELSKDASELLPPADSQQAIQYYLYVQAARNGQEQKDCLRLHPNCKTDFHRKKRR